MLKLLLVRHGETEWNRVRRIQGARSDTPLSEAGIAQAEMLSRALQHVGISHIYSSPMGRAMTTAAAVARPHNLPVIKVDGFKEIDAGDYEGKIAGSPPGVMLSNILVRDGNGDMPRLPGGESLVDLQARAWPPLREIISRHNSGIVVVTSHYFTILTLICSILGFPIDTAARMTMGTASITTIRCTSKSATLLTFDDTCHLTQENA